MYLYNGNSYFHRVNKGILRVILTVKFAGLINSIGSREMSDTFLLYLFVGGLSLGFVCGLCVGFALVLDLLYVKIGGPSKG